MGSWREPAWQELSEFLSGLRVESLEALYVLNRGRSRCPEVHVNDSTTLGCWYMGRAGYSTGSAELPLSPFQLGAQHIEECSLKMQQLYLLSGFAAADAVAVEHGHSDLAVEAQIGFVGTGLHDDFNLRRVSHNQRSVRQRVL